MTSPPIASPPTTDSTTSSIFSRLLRRVQPPPESLVLLLAMLIGGGAGLGIITFHYLIALIQRLALEDLMGVIAPWGAWTLAIVPILGGMVVSLMRWYSQNFSSPQDPTLATTANLPELSPFRPVTKMVAAAVSLGTGASLGPEGPSVEIGANLGTLISQVMQVSQERQRLLLGAGAAAGFAAGFNAPIAGVFFALEVVLGTTFATSAVSVVLLAAVVAAWTAQFGLGGQPAFNLPAYEVRGLWELPLYIGLGLLASLVSLTFTQTVKLSQSFFAGQVKLSSWLNRIPRALHPILGGLCVGIVALKFPQIMGVGYETIEAILRDVEFSLPLLVMLLVAKLIMTAISSGSGLVGGIYAPALFLGSALGAAYGKILQILLLGHLSIAAPPAYAMVGMAAVLAGSVRAPLTAILLLFELTRDYRIVLPLMAAVGLSVWLVDYLKPVATGLNLQQMGLNVKHDQHQELLQQLRVDEAMQINLVIVPESLPVLEAGQQLLSHHAHSALVVNGDGHLRGIMTLQDIDRALNHLSLHQIPGSTPLLLYVQDVCTTDLICAYRDESLADALDRMASRGLHQLPVVEREQPDRVIGLLERDSIQLTCSLAATRRSLQSHQPSSTMPLPTSEVRVAEAAVEINPTSILAISTQPSLREG